MYVSGGFGVDGAEGMVWRDGVEGWCGGIGLWWRGRSSLYSREVNFTTK